MNMPTDDETPAARAVRLMGGPVGAARQLGVENYQTVQGWVRNGIPPRYCLRVERISGVGRKELRPADWSDYWTESELSAEATCGVMAADVLQESAPA